MRSFFAAIALTLATASFALAGDPAAVKVDKKPADIQRRSFDLKHPPREMGPLNPGDDGLCDSEFKSNAACGAQAEQTDATHAKMTINSVEVKLECTIIVWVPTNPPKGVREHEEGHRQISEFYYKYADAVARRVAAPYLGKQVDVSGPNFQAEMKKVLGQASTDITEAYNKEMPVEKTQARYDEITDHSRKDIPVPDAIAQAIKETAPEWAKAATPKAGP